MDKKALLESARQLKQVNVAAATEYYQKSEQLITIMNSRMMERADIERLVGKNNLSIMTDNHANHVRFIASILKNYNPEVLVETILWVFRAYRSHGFTTNYWAAQLNTWLMILKESLTEACYVEVYPYYEWMQISIPIFVKITDDNQDPSGSGN